MSEKVVAPKLKVRKTYNYIIIILFIIYVIVIILCQVKPQGLRPFFHT